MFFPANCPEWFWIFPLLGMLFMVGMMFFMARIFMKGGGMANCCGGQSKADSEHKTVDNGNR